MLTLTASGSVSDYSDSDKSSLQQKVADAAGVDKSLVTIRVAAASVRVTATIAVPTSMTADEVQTSLSSTLGTADAASTALGLTVEEVPTSAVALAEPPSTPPPSPLPLSPSPPPSTPPPGSDDLKSDDPQSSCDAGCIGGVVAGCFVLFLMCTGWLSGALAKSGCPSPSKKPTRPQDPNRIKIQIH